MRFNILYDADWEARIDKVLDVFSDSGYRSFFEEREYGESVSGITIVLMCQDPSLKLKQRIRFSKKEKKLYLDIMLDLNQFKQIVQSQREKIVSEKITTELPVIIGKYNFKDFNLSQFEEDLKVQFNKY